MKEKLKFITIDTSDENFTAVYLYKDGEIIKQNVDGTMSAGRFVYFDIYTWLDIIFIEWFNLGAFFFKIAHN
jgi:hypothetical protein